ncbi:retrovirus-related pol polyprotein from transposon TNT 1-94 [Tanacetum coccineum]
MKCTHWPMYSSRIPGGGVNPNRSIHSIRAYTKRRGDERKNVFGKATLGNNSKSRCLEPKGLSQASIVRLEEPFWWVIASHSKALLAEHSVKVNPFAPANPEPFVNVFAPEPGSEASSSGDEIHEFDRLDVWELVPPPDCAKIIALKISSEEVLTLRNPSPQLPGLKLSESSLPMLPTSKEEVYVSQPEVFVDPDCPNHGLPSEESLYGLKQALWACCSVDIILKPTKKHLEAIKRIFQYIQGTINMGLWYSKDTAMALTAYADADYAGCQDTRRSTYGSAQLLGDKLVSWSSKKQTSTSISSTKAEYIAMSGYYAQILWMRSQLSDYGFAYNRVPLYCDKNSAIALCYDNIFVLFHHLILDTMADVNVNAPAEQAPAMAPPARTDDQILPRIRWVPIGKSNCYLDVERSQSNPIYKIVVDILKHTNFFRAFTASSTIPSIYIQQFWDTVRYDNKTGNYSCQLDEQWFDLTKDTLRDALQITPVDTNNAFSSPPTPDALIKFVNDLGYPKVVRHLSDVILWGIVNRAHIDYAERMWEEFTQSIHTFIEDKKNLAHHTQRKKKATLIVIPSVRFTKMIVYYLQIKHKFHPRPGSPLHLLNEEPVLGYLKFSAKGTKWEVFGMPIPNDLIIDDIRGEQYYNAYLEKVAKHQRYLAGEEVSDPDSPVPKPAKATKPKASKQSKPLAPKAATKKPKPAPTKPHSLQLVDEFIDEGIPENEPRIGDEEADLQKAVEESLKEFHSVRQGPLPPVVIREPESGKFQPLPKTPKKKSPANHFIFQRRTSTPTESSGHDESSSLYAELGLTDSETDSDEEVPGIVDRVQDEGQAGPNPGEQDGASDTSIQPNPEQIDEEFTTTAYLNVQENLKLPTEGKELSFADQFLVEKSQEDKPEKTNTKSEVQSMIPVPIHQDTSSVPLMTIPVINLTVSQPVPTAVQAPLPTLTTTVTATTTMITTTLLPIPPQPQQGSLDSILIKRIGELEQHMADLVEANQSLEERLDKQWTKSSLMLLTGLFKLLSGIAS